MILIKVSDVTYALFVKIGVLDLWGYWWFTGINHRVAERTEDERTENDYLKGYRMLSFFKVLVIR